MSFVSMSATPKNGLCIFDVDPINVTYTVDKRLVSSQAARHRYLCPGTGINPRVSPASLPEKPSIHAQAGSNPNETNSSFASMIGSCWKREKETEWLCTPPFTPCGRGTPLGAYSSLVQSKDSQVALRLVILQCAVIASRPVDQLGATCLRRSVGGV